MKSNFKALSEDYLLSLLLNEAPEDQTNMPQDDEATYEPQEQDADMGDDSGGGDDLDMEGMDDGGEMGDGGNSSNEDMGGGGMGGTSDGTTIPNTTPVNEVFKKRKLFKDYKNLLEAVDDLMNSATSILAKNLPEDVQKVFLYINEKMEENREKLVIILTEQYLNLSYQQLLTLYMYIKISTKTYADMLKQVYSVYVRENK